MMRTAFERLNRPHKIRHPNDTNTPKEKGVCRTESKSKDRRKEKKELHTLLDVLDREKALRYPRKVIQSVAHEYMMEFWKRQQDNTDEFDPDPDPLLDDEGEIILYPNGGGGGKGAIVDWLLRYNNFFHDIRKENILTEAMRQSILD